MKRFIIQILFGVLAATSYGQECLTPATPDFLQEYPPYRLAPNNLTFTVKIFVHIINKDDGTGGVTEEQVRTELDRLEAYYEPHDICFALTGIDEINDSEYGDSAGDTISPAQSTQIIADYPPIPDVVDIYILPSSIFFRGSAFAIPNTYLLIFAGRFNTPHLAHEMGHCLGLYHPHETAFGAELVDGSNCNGAGDLLCDTPADPNLSGKVNGLTCNYTGTDMDANGDSYNPDVTNTMSYAPFGCRGSFTQDQEDRMHSILMSNFTVVNEILVDDMALIIANGSINSGTQIETSLDYIESFNYEVSGNAVAHFIAEDYITLSPDFRAFPNAQGDFWAYINLYCDGEFPDGIPIENFIENTPSFVNGTGNFSSKSPDQLEIFPNPTAGRIQVSYSIPKNDHIRIVITNKHGQTLRIVEDHSFREKGNHKFELDLNKWPSGSYYLMITTSEDNRVKPFIINKL